MDKKPKQKVLVIVGPTASGKSALGVEIALERNGEIISADSRQVYRGLNLGTGKITPLEMKGVRHHLLDVASPRKNFSAHEYLTRAQRAIEDIVSRNKCPIIVGGTGFYIDALLGRITLPDVAPNTELRKRLAHKTAKELVTILKRKDPRRARMLDPNNHRRLIRAIEITEALGKTPRMKTRDLYEVEWIGLAPDSKTLKAKIEMRLQERMDQGMIEEAKRLHAGGLTYKRMEELGLEYRSLARYLRGKICKEEMVRELTRDIVRYSKRQMTYWRRNKDIVWRKI